MGAGFCLRLNVHFEAKTNDTADRQAGSVATIQWQPSQDFEGCLHNNTGRSSRRRGHVHGSVDGWLVLR